MFTFSSIISTFISFLQLSSISEPSLDDENINNTPHNPTSTQSPIEIESATEAPSATNDLEPIQNFSKRVSLGGLGASITLIVSTPSNAAAHRILNTGYVAAAFIGVFAAVLLALYAVKGKSNRIMMSLMFLTVAFDTTACLLRLVFALPFL